ncbi:cellulose-binding domain-containing protein [Actinoplanes sp. NPDC051851]|uniref:cellulose-binding domain-containing protein n=1 Tax=Actinoplanes sp. NPDC051851 TaxID=3154753 RepID=UPI0034251BA5
MKALLAMALLVAAGAVGLSSAARAATTCDVAYTVNQWDTGFTADVKVTNTGPAVTSWTVSWTFAGNQQITSAWNATVTQTGTAVTAASLAWNGALATGASASFGFQGTYSGTNAVPAAFTCGPVVVDPAPSTSPTFDTDCLGTALCDGFESGLGNWAVTTPDCSGAGTAAIDGTEAHTGSASLRIAGAAGYCNHVFVRSTGILGATTNVWYVRYWVKHTTALPAAHVTAVAMTDANDSGKDLRFGGQNGALQFNRASDDATLPEQSPAGVALSAPLPVDTWTCVEFKIDGTDGTMETWLNGTSVPGLLEDGVATHDIDSQWLNRTWRPALTDLKLGWESYGDGADTLWYDDVAVGSTRNGC